MAERDPVCGMMVEPGDAIVLDHGSHRHYFCSAGCRDQFQAAPKRYHDTHSAAGRGDVDVEKHEPPFTKTGFIVAPKFGSAGSGGAEFELPPEQHDEEDR